MITKIDMTKIPRHHRHPEDHLTNCKFCGSTKRIGPQGRNIWKKMMANLPPEILTELSEWQSSGS